MARQELSEIEWVRSVYENNPRLAEIAAQHARMIELAIMAGERDRAIGIVGLAFDAMIENCITTESSVADLVGERVASILDVGAKIKTVGQLCRWTTEELLTIRGIDYPSIRRIVERLQKNSLSLRKINSL
jgi:hypothetical protein